MEQTNEGRCPVGGVPPHGSEHVMVLLIPVVRGTSDDWIERKPPQKSTVKNRKIHTKIHYDPLLSHYE